MFKYYPDVRSNVIERVWPSLAYGTVLIKQRSEVQILPPVLGTWPNGQGNRFLTDRL